MHNYIVIVVHVISINDDKNWILLGSNISLTQTTLLILSKMFLVLPQLKWDYLR